MIPYFHRKKKQIQTERVYGGGGVRFFYENPLGLAISRSILSRKWISNIVGAYQSTAWSAKKIPRFIKNYAIDMTQFEEVKYASFNDFFIRKFKDGARPFVSGGLAAPCEARYFGWQSASAGISYPVKGEYLSAKALLTDASGADSTADPMADRFAGGPILIARLCPVDYHRYHYPDDGFTVATWPIHGKYFSVNPVALKSSGDIFTVNERRVAILQTKNFGTLAFIEVGAVCVGRIVQSHGSDPFKKGDEKGYFLFGGSTVILLGEKGAFVPSKDILENTANKIETYIELGDAISA